jgi:4-amino-4-deoxy-L-arabinose transferase-like glycosyltransferase
MSASPFSTHLDRTHREGPTCLQVGILIAILLFALGIRSYGLDAVSLWIDEILTAGRVNGSFDHVLRGLDDDSPFPPLYYFIVKLFTSVLGVNEVSLRLPSVIFSVLGVFVVYRLGALLFGVRAGLIAALLTSISTYNIHYAQEAKMYAQLWFFALVTFYYFILWIDTRKPAHLLIYAIATELSLYTSYHGFIYWGLQNLFLVAYSIKERRSIPRYWWATQATILLLFAPWLPRMLFQTAEHRGIDWVPSIDTRGGYIYFFKVLFLRSLDLRPWEWEYPYPHTSPLPLLICLQILVYAALTPTAFFKVVKTRRPIFLGGDTHVGEALLLLWTAGTLILFILMNVFYHPILVDRYLGFIHLPIFLLLSKSISRLSFPIRTAVLAFILTMAAVFNLTSYLHPHAKLGAQNWREVGQLVQKGDCAHSVIVVSQKLHGHALGNFYALFNLGFSQYNNCFKDMVSEYMVERGVYKLSQENIYYLVLRGDETGPQPDLWKDFELTARYTFPQMTVLEYQPRQHSAAGRPAH